MKLSPLRYLIALMTLLVPAFACAQQESDVLPDLAKKTLGIAHCFTFNNQLGIYQVNLNDSTFELIALNNNMQIQWRNQFKGNGVFCGRFKDNILAIADSGYSRRSWVVNPYYAYLVDQKTGKAILQKEIFKQEAKHQEMATGLFTGDDFSLFVRQTNRKLGVFNSSKDNTEDLTVVGLDDKLEPSYVKPKFPNETFVSLTANGEGDLFILTVKDGSTLAARRYEHGSTEPSEPILLKCDSLGDFDLFRGYNAITPSGEDRNTLFLAIAHNNHDDDRELFVGKFDFAARTAKSTSEVFTGKYIRGLEKAYVPFNDQLPKPNIGSQKKELTIKYFREHNGKLLTILAEDFFATVYNITTYYQKSFIINCYDNDLNKQFQQLMPAYSATREPLNTAYAISDNDLQIVTNNTEPDDHPAYGRLDLATGKWVKLEILKAADEYYSDQHVLWFSDGFIVPSLRRQTFGKKISIDLVSYIYQ